MESCLNITTDWSVLITLLLQGAHKPVEVVNRESHSRSCNIIKNAFPCAKFYMVKRKIDLLHTKYLR